MASFLAGYGSPDALAVARDLDAKIERLLTAVSALSQPPPPGPVTALDLR